MGVVILEKPSIGTFSWIRFACAVCEVVYGGLRYLGLDGWFCRYGIV